MLEPHKLKALAIELAAAMPPDPDALPDDAMDVAQFYMQATAEQRAALDAVVAAFRKASGTSR